MKRWKIIREALGLGKTSKEAKAENFEVIKIDDEINRKSTSFMG